MTITQYLIAGIIRICTFLVIKVPPVQCHQLAASLEASYWLYFVVDAAAVLAHVAAAPVAAADAVEGH